MILTLLVLVPLLTGFVCWPLRERAVLERLLSGEIETPEPTDPSPPLAPVQDPA